MRTLLRLALGEDIGSGDLTTRLTVARGTRGRGRVVAREPLVVAGLALFAPLVEELIAMGEPGAASLTLTEQVAEGSRVEAGASLCTIDGEAGPILTLERTLLNFVGHLSGVATETARVVGLVREAGCSTRILDTRKTTPGMRRLEKYAVLCGGGSNHRIGLFDAVLIKDNHVIAAGGIDRAVKAALAGAPPGTDVEVECDTLEQVNVALASGAKAVLLDNFPVERVAEAVALIAGRARVEVSGGIGLDSVVAYAKAGPDAISLGRLTHSARSVDVSMEITLLV